LRNFKDDSRKKENEVKDLTNESVKISNEYSKKIALLE
jgi:hypothetical protein